MKWPCALGFGCPYRRSSIEGDVCIYPEEHILAEAVECPLMSKGPLLDFLREYEDNNRRKAR